MRYFFCSLSPLPTHIRTNIPGNIIWSAAGCVVTLRIPLNYYYITRASNHEKIRYLYNPPWIKTQRIRAVDLILVPFQQTKFTLRAQTALLCVAFGSPESFSVDVSLFCHRSDQGWRRLNVRLSSSRWTWHQLHSAPSSTRPCANSTWVCLRVTPAWSPTSGSMAPEKAFGARPAPCMRSPKPPKVINA